MEEAQVTKCPVTTSSGAPLPSTTTLTPDKSTPSTPTPPRTPSLQALESIRSNGAEDSNKHALSASEMVGTTATATSQDSHQHHHKGHRHTTSNASVETVSSHRSRKDYMDSLVPPTSQEMSRISQVQMQREQDERRRSRQQEKEQRKSTEASQTSLDNGNNTHDIEQRRPTKTSHGSIFSSHRHKNPSVDTSAAHNNTVNNSSSRQGSATAVAIASATAAGEPPDDGENLRVHRAATLIQRTFRGYKTRREIKGLALNADTRWTHAIREMRFREMTKPRGKDDIPMLASNEGSQQQVSGVGGGGGADADAVRRASSARYKWKKIAVIAGRAAGDMDDDPSSMSDSDSEDAMNAAELTAPQRRRKAHQKREEAKARRRKDARMMGLPYFLEMVDLKHRYGSNLRTYHEEWKKADTQEPFFYWLDYGEGRIVEVSACPRERLDREQVRYLSREERQYYLVQVDKDGRLCWAKNGARIDTTERWRDSIHGVVPVDDPTPAFRPKATDPNEPQPFPTDSSGSSSSAGSSVISNASESEREAARAAKYASPGFHDAKGVKKVTHMSASTIFNSLLRKSVKKNTWIFVADTSFRLYVGIKDSGAFQHSSFLQGSRISAAGLIKVKNGRLTSLSPLSGHYRPPASNFRAFVRSLKEEGVDMSHVSISKSYAVLVGLEMYMKTRQKGKNLMKKATHKKDKIVHPEVAQAREEDAKDKSQSAEKERRFLERQAVEKHEANRAAAKVMQKLRISSSAAVATAAEEPKDDGQEKAGEEELDEAMEGITEVRSEEERGSAAGEPVSEEQQPVITGTVDDDEKSATNDAR